MSTNSGPVARLEQFKARYLPSGSLRRSLASGAVWSLLGAVFSRGFVLLAGILVARLLGKEGFGQWGLVLQTVSTFAQLASLGIVGIASKHVAEFKHTDPLRAGRSLSFILVAGLISTSLMTLACLALAWRVSFVTYGRPELFVPHLLASTLVFGTVATNMLQGTLAGFEDFRGIARNNVIQGVANFVATVPLTWFFGLNGAVLSVSVAYFASASAGLARVISNSRRYGMPLALTGIWRESGILWRHALPDLLTGLMTGPAAMKSQGIVANIPGGVLGLGGYQAAVRWRTLVLFVPQAVAQVALPMLSKLRGEGDYRRYVKALWVNAGLNGGMALACSLPVMLLSPWILGLYGPEFREDWPLMCLLVGSGVFQAMEEVLAQVTRTLDKRWFNLLSHIVYVSVLLGGTALLVPRYGVNGYVYALVSATCSLAMCAGLWAMILPRSLKTQVRSKDGP